MRFAWWADPRIPMERRERARRAREAAVQAIAWKLPRRLAYWACIRVGVEATTGEHSDQIVPDLTYFEALDRWHYES